MDWMTNWFFDFLFNVQRSIASIVDFIRQIFFMLAGISPVTVEGEETEILSHFLLSPTVRNAFLYILLIAFVLLTIFVIIAIIRSEYAHNEQQKKTKSQILGKAFISFLIFLLVPFILISGIYLTNTVMQSVNIAMTPGSGGGTSTIGGQLLVTSGSGAWIGDDSLREEIERKFISGELDYRNRSLVSQYWRIRDIDYFVGIGGGLVILIMFVLSAVMFIQRLFDVILLFIISPVSISTIPVDDGNRFRLWREMTISKVLGAYGIIIAMNLFFIIIPQINNITFFTNSWENGLVRILFLIGGAFAVTKAHMVIAQLTGSNAGNQEAQQMMANMRTMRTIGGGVIGTAGMALGGAQFHSAKRMYGLKGAVSSTFNTHASRQYAAPTREQSKVELYSKMPTRLATMPIGMIKDLASGGVVGMTKNIAPRFRNLVSGDSYVSHAQKKPEPGSQKRKQREDRNKEVKQNEIDSQEYQS